jgi:anthranilate phosphoribosyltransferase
MLMKSWIEKVIEGENLTSDEASAALDLIMRGSCTNAQIAALLVALRAKGETVEEIVGFARTMRQHAVRVRVDDPNAIDMCGTGGDGKGTFNISTVASLVAAGAGATVAKHGNKSVSSRSGSADVLSALGVNIQLPAARVESCINEVGIGFLFAPMFHPSMKHAAPARSELGVRTIFNMLGPLTNPAGVRKQLVGTFRADAAPRLAGALKMLETEKSVVVHSDDGLDEVSVSANTRVLEVAEGCDLRSYTISPDDLHVATHGADAMGGGTPEDNAAMARRVLAGEKGPLRDVVVANASMGLYVSGKVRSLGEGSALAAESIDSGRAADVLSRLVDYTARG